MPRHNETLITVATYNEIDCLPKLVDQILAHVPEVDILVIDDNSPDGTGDWCDEKAQEDPRVQCLHRTGKLGLGTAVLAGLSHAVENGYTYVVNMDADLSHPPQKLPALIDAVRSDSSIDVAIGSRYVPGGGIEGWPAKRHFMSRAINLYSRFWLRLPVKDCSGSFRCYRTLTLQKLDFDAIVSRGYSFMEELLWWLRRVDAKFTEIPITFIDRELGQSKINAGEAYAALWILFKLGLRR